MQKLLSGLLLVALLLTGATLLRAEDLSVNAYPLKSPPALDGKWNTGCWKALPVISGFGRMKTAELTESRQTLFKIGYHGKNLYVSIKCEEPDVNNIKTDKANYRDGWYPDDHVEFIFNDSNKENKNHLQFVVNSTSGRWCNFATHGKSNLWKAAAYKGKEYWGVTIEIPFSLLRIKGDFTKTNYYFNIARIANGNVSKDKLTCYGKVFTGFTHSIRFPALFIKKSADAKAMAADAKRLDRLTKFYRGRLWKIAYVREDFFEKRKGNPDLKKVEAIKKQAKKILASKNLSKASSVIIAYDRLANMLASPIKSVKFTLKKKNASVKLFVNGNAVTVSASGKGKIDFEEGFSVLTAECAATGKDPGVSILFDAPEMNGSFKVAANPGKEFRKENFNDSSWQKPAAKKGFLWSKDPADKKPVFRQIVLWNRSHDGPNRCIHPKVRSWGFSIDSTEPLFLTLNAPLPFQGVKGKKPEGKAKKYYSMTLDLPAGFRLLDLKHDQAYGWWGNQFKLNCIPTSVSSKKIAVRGKKFTRYTITFDKADIRNDQSQPCILPVQLDQSRKAGEKDVILYRRSIDGNFTELTQTLPVHILPPINGRMAKEFMLSTYCSVPYFGAQLSPEALKAVMRDAGKVGFNYWMARFGASKKPTGFNKIFDDEVRKMKGKYIGVSGNFPAWRGSLGWSDVRKFVDTVPGAKARYFKDFKAVIGVNTNLKTVKENWNAAAMYCPTFVVNEGRKAFMAATKKTLEKRFNYIKKEMGIYWINWESEPWQNGNVYTPAKTGLGSYCFCDRCKNDFKKTIKYPANKPLADEVIFQKYYNEWKLFRYGLDGKVQGIIRDVCKELGWKYMVYSWVDQYGFWEASKGKFDLAFPGCPGNAPANSLNQEFMDHSMKYFREKIGCDSFMGQRFSFFGTYYSRGPNGWKSYSVMSPDGYIDAKSWKPQLIRIAASVHAGLDMQSTMECVAGMMYYMGEATRAIAHYEPIFVHGRRNDALASAKEIKYPNLLVVAKGKERLVLLFNEGEKPLTVNLENKKLLPGQKATIWEKKGGVSDPARMKVVVPAEDVLIIHIK